MDMELEIGPLTNQNIKMTIQIYSYFQLDVTFSDSTLRTSGVNIKVIITEVNIVQQNDWVSYCFIDHLT